MFLYNTLEITQKALNKLDYFSNITIDEENSLPKKIILIFPNTKISYVKLSKLFSAIIRENGCLEDISIINNENNINIVLHFI